METIWIITRSINQYDQDGDYFEMAFLTKPSIDQLIEIFKCNKQFAEHLLKGGGRIANEDAWYYLTELKSGQEYEAR